MGRNRFIRHTLLKIAAAASVVGSLTGFPTISYAKTIGELDESIAKIEASLAMKEQAVAETQAELSNNIKTAYKSNNGGNPTLDALMDSDGLESIVSNEQYARSINRKYIESIRNASNAVSELASAKSTLETLRAEKAAQEESRRNADMMHFCQAGEYYSDIRYYCGTIGNAGCGLCAYTVAINILKGTDYTPDTMLPVCGDWQGLVHYPDDTTGTPDGTTHATWTKNNFDVEMTTMGNSVSELRSALSDGESVVIILSRGYVFKNKAGNWRWSAGHYVCAYRCDDGGFYIQDSSYKGDSGAAVYYTDSEIQGMLNAGTLIKLSN